MIGPCGVRSDDAEEPDAGLEADVFGLNAVIVCETPSARINCSRSSMFVRPLAVIVKCGKSVRKLRNVGYTRWSLEEGGRKNKQNKQKSNLLNKMHNWI